MQLIAIVPATDAPATLNRCVNAIWRALEPPNEVRVIDDPSVLGPARARNLGAEEARSETIVFVFVDADVEVHTDAFVRIRRAFEADDDLAAIFGSYDDDPSARTLVSDFRNLLHHHVHHTAAGPATTFWAGLGAIRRSDFLTLEGFDEERFPRASIEDIDLGMRLAREGRHIVLDPAIQGKHLKRWTLASMIRTDFARRGVPWVRLLLEKRASSDALNLGLRHRASATASVALVVGFATRRPRVIGAAGIVLLALNASFYLLLLRRRGPTQAAAGIPLHVLHHLTGVVAVPIGLLQHLVARGKRGQDDYGDTRV
jgi:GT2 family glycosyltransferase